MKLGLLTQQSGMLPRDHCNLQLGGVGNNNGRSCNTSANSSVRK